MVQCRHLFSYITFDDGIKNLKIIFYETDNIQRKNNLEVAEQN